MSAQFSLSSCASRDFPIPGSPTSSTSVPKPIRTGATDAPSTARSRSRSTNGSSSWAVGGLGPLGCGEELAENERLDGLAFPLSVSGSSSVDSNDPPPRVSAPAETQISSSPARAMSRAASAAVSPSTVYVRRKLAPTWPVNTRPSLTPMWTGSGKPDVDDARVRSGASAPRRLRRSVGRRRRG